MLAPTTTHTGSALLEAGLYWRLVSTGGWSLLEVGLYWRLASTGGWPLLEAGLYWMVATKLSLFQEAQLQSTFLDTHKLSDVS